MKLRRKAHCAHLQFHHRYKFRDITNSSSSKLKPVITDFSGKVKTSHVKATKCAKQFERYFFSHCNGRRVIQYIRNLIEVRIRFYVVPTETVDYSVTDFIQG